MKAIDTWRAGGKGKGAYTFQARSASQVPFTVKGATGQTANLFEAKNVSGSTVFSIDVLGNVTYLGDEYVTDALTVNGNALVSGTLDVTGATTLGTVSAGDTTLTSLSSGNTVLSVLGVTGNAQVNGTLSVGNYTATYSAGSLISSIGGTSMFKFTSTGIQFLQTANEVIMPDNTLYGALQIKDAGGFEFFGFDSSNSGPFVRVLGMVDMAENTWTFYRETNTFTIPANFATSLVIKDSVSSLLTLDTTTGAHRLDLLNGTVILADGLIRGSDTNGTFSLDLENNQADATAVDLALINGRGLNDASPTPENLTYAQIALFADDNTDNAEDGGFSIGALLAGTMHKPIEYSDLQLVLTLVDNQALGAFKIAGNDAYSYLQIATTNGSEQMSLMGQVGIMDGQTQFVNADGNYSLQLQNQTATPAFATVLGNIQALGQSSTGVTRAYGSESFSVGDDTNGAEYAIYRMGMIRNGVDADALTFMNLAAVTGGAINVDEFDIGGGAVPLLMSMGAAPEDTAGTWSWFAGQEGGESTANGGYAGGAKGVSGGMGSDAFSGDTNGGAGGAYYSAGGAGGAESGSGNAGAAGTQYLGYMPLTSIFGLPFADYESNVVFGNNKADITIATGLANFSNGGIRTKISSADVTAVAPTDAELDSAFGTPATVGAGFTALLNDNGDGIAEFVVWSDGTNWFWAAGTKAL